MNNLLQNLNSSQLEPTLQTDGPMIVIAGAGSGKTRVLTYKIAYLMSKGVDAFNILALTFTNKAAKEMKQRISSMLDDNESKNLWIGTFHSVFAKILRIEADKLGYPTNFTIYDTQDSQKLVSSIISVEECYWVEAVEVADSLGVDIINTSLGYKGYDNSVLLLWHFYLV